MGRGSGTIRGRWRPRSVWGREAAAEIPLQLDSLLKKHFRASGFAWGFAFAVVALFVVHTCVYPPPPAPAHSQTKYGVRAN